MVPPPASRFPRRPDLRHAPAPVQGLAFKRVEPAFAQVRAAIEAGDVKSADVEKLHTGGDYRAKLDHNNRLLLQFTRCDGEAICQALAVIANQPCDQPRFLRGAQVDKATSRTARLLESADV